MVVRKPEGAAGDHSECDRPHPAATSSLAPSGMELLPSRGPSQLIQFFGFFFFCNFCRIYCTISYWTNPYTSAVFQNRCFYYPILCPQRNHPQKSYCHQFCGQHRAKAKVTLVTAEINTGRKGKNKHTHTEKTRLEKLSRAVVSQNLPGKRKDLPQWLTLGSHTPDHSAVRF